LNIRAKFFEELTTRQLYEIVRSRTEIFLLEQRIICQDFDGVDYEALHCFFEEEGRVVAYLRAYRAEGAVKIGRVLSLTHGAGLGRRLMEEALPIIREKFSCERIIVHAQKQAQGFYEKLGFTVTSPDYLEEGILHVTMEFTA
jgi:ElaA protein